MKRSRSGHLGLAGLWRRWRFHSTSAISAMPIGAPGWPEFAFCTASTASIRIAPVMSLNLGGVMIRVAAISGCLLCVLAGLVVNGAYNEFIWHPEHVWAGNYAAAPRLGQPPPIFAPCQDSSSP